MHPHALFMREALSRLSTREELSYFISCNNDDSVLPSGLRGFDGSELLAFRMRYCKIVVALLCILELCLFYEPGVLGDVSLIISNSLKYPYAGFQGGLI